MSENDKLDPIAAFDQVGTTLENAAVIFSNYHKKLLEGGIPPDLASQMVRDIQTMFFGKLTSR
jgi:hypothetical protein